MQLRSVGKRQVGRSIRGAARHDGGNLYFMHVIAVAWKSTYVHTYACTRPLIRPRWRVNALHSDRAPSTARSEMHLDCDRREMPRALRFGWFLAPLWHRLSLPPSLSSVCGCRIYFPIFSFTPPKSYSHRDVCINMTIFASFMKLEELWIISWATFSYDTHWKSFSSLTVYTNSLYVQKTVWWLFM